MTGTDLHGYWSTANLDQGSMEAQAVVFLPDGTGWWKWMNAMGFEVDRFRWQVASPGHLTVHIFGYFGGTTHFTGGRPLGRRGRRTLEHRVERQHDENLRNATRYTIAAAQDAWGNDATVLETAERNAFSLLGGSRSEPHLRRGLSMGFTLGRSMPAAPLGVW